MNSLLARLMVCVPALLGLLLLDLACETGGSAERFEGPPLRSAPARPPSFERLRRPPPPAGRGIVSEASGIDRGSTWNDVAIASGNGYGFRAAQMVPKEAERREGSVEPERAEPESTDAVVEAPADTSPPVGETSEVLVTPEPVRAVSPTEAVVPEQTGESFGAPEDGEEAPLDSVLADLEKDLGVGPEEPQQPKEKAEAQAEVAESRNEESLTTVSPDVKEPPALAPAEHAGDETEKTGEEPLEELDLEELLNDVLDDDSDADRAGEGAPSADTEPNPGDKTSAAGAIGDEGKSDRPRVAGGTEAGLISDRARQRRAEEALKKLRLSTEARKAEARYFLKRAREFLAEGEEDKAVEFLNRAVARDPLLKEEAEKLRGQIGSG